MNTITPINDYQNIETFAWVAAIALLIAFRQEIKKLIEFILMYLHRLVV